ncbi:hypothetical protein HK100_009188, partial [Physocladia obscura]
MLQILSALFKSSRKTIKRTARSPLQKEDEENLLSISSVVSEYERWCRGVLESIIWFNSFVLDDVECLCQIVESQGGVDVASLTKLLRIAVAKLPQESSSQPPPSDTHNAGVIVASNLVAAVLTRQLETRGEDISNVAVAYDARLRVAVRRVTALLAGTDGIAGDIWEREKTRSFALARVEHSVSVYIEDAAKRRHDETAALLARAVRKEMRSRKAISLQVDNKTETSGKIREDVNRSLLLKTGDKQNPQSNVVQYILDGFSSPLVSVGTLLT